MHINDLQQIAELAGLPVLSDNDPAAEALLKPERCLEIAEAVDAVRLFDLLHRHEYRPVAIMQFGRAPEGEVRVYFDCVEAAAECGCGSTSTSQLVKPATSPRFLIADRDPTIREECRRFLAARGYDVGVASDGLQCIEQLRGMAPTVLALDPEILWGGGAGVLEWLRDEAPITPLSVLLINGESCVGIPVRLQALVSGRLERPRSLRELAQFVNQLEYESARRRAVRHHGVVRAIERGF